MLPGGANDHGIFIRFYLADNLFIDLSGFDDIAEL